MAGLFGSFFNYDKEGPGVEKDAPEKKGFIVFFEIFFKNFWKLAICSIWFIALCFPIVTNGLAFAGFTNVTRNMSLDRHSFGTSDFFDTVKKNWKQALAAGIINLIIYMVLIAFTSYDANHDGYSNHFSWVGLEHFNQLFNFQVYFYHPLIFLPYLI